MVVSEDGGDGIWILVIVNCGLKFVEGFGVFICVCFCGGSCVGELNF